MLFGGFVGFLARTYGNMINLISKISLRDICLFLLFPAVLTAIELISELNPVFRQSLKLNLCDPRWWQLLTSSYVHVDFSHYLYNCVSFLFFGALGLVLTADIIYQSRYLFTLFSIELSLPFISSIFKLAFYPIFSDDMIITSCGSSGIISAVLGSVLIFWMINLSFRRDRDLVNYRFRLLVLAYIVLAFESIYRVFRFDPFLYAGTAFFFIALLISYGKTIIEILVTILDEFEYDVVMYLTLVLAPFAFFWCTFSLFPPEFISAGNFTDIIAHFFGLTFGILITSYLGHDLYMFKKRSKKRVLS